jgi:galactose mutarotase-like enzyme
VNERELLQTVTIRSASLQVDVLPSLGGKISSLRWLPHNLELLQPPLIPYRPRTPWMKFEDSDASGFDECIPSIAECEVDSPGGPIRIPDHGEFWRLPWSCTQLADGISMEATSEILQLRFERTLRVTDDTTIHSSSLGSSKQSRSAATLEVTYRLWNIGRSSTQYLWSAHPLFAVDAGDCVLLPESVKNVTVEWSAQQRLGSLGDACVWPHAKSSSGKQVDLGNVGSVESRVGEKLYASAPKEGWAAILRSRHAIRIEVLFDPLQSPYLGLWLCYGGWPEDKSSRQHCVAIEPCTAPADSLVRAMETRSAKQLTAGEMHTWCLKIRVNDL